MHSLLQFGPWFILLAVVVMYCTFFFVRRAGKKSVWPPGHPWAPITLLLVAFQQFATVYHWNIASLWVSAVSAITFVTSGLWIWTGVKEYRLAIAAARMQQEELVQDGTAQEPEENAE